MISKKFLTIGLLSMVGIVQASSEIVRIEKRDPKDWVLSINTSSNRIPPLIESSKDSPFAASVGDYEFVLHGTGTFDKITDLEIPRRVNGNEYLALYDKKPRGFVGWGYNRIFEKDGLIFKEYTNPSTGPANHPQPKSTGAAGNKVLIIEDGSFRLEPAQ